MADLRRVGGAVRGPGGSGGGGDDAAQERTVRELYGYLGLEADDARVGATCRQLFSSDSPTFRKGAIGQWRDQFDDELEALFARSVGDRMQKYGYEPSGKDDRPHGPPRAPSSPAGVR